MLLSVLKISTFIFMREVEKQKWTFKIPAFMSFHDVSWTKANQKQKV